MESVPALTENWRYVQFETSPQTSEDAPANTPTQRFRPLNSRNRSKTDEATQSVATSIFPL